MIHIPLPIDQGFQVGFRVNASRTVLGCIALGCHRKACIRQLDQPHLFRRQGEWLIMMYNCLKPLPRCISLLLNLRSRFLNELHRLLRLLDISSDLPLWTRLVYWRVFLSGRGYERILFESVIHLQKPALAAIAIDGNTCIFDFDPRWQR